MHATAVTASRNMPAGQLSARTTPYNGELLQLLRALTSGSIVPFVLVKTTNLFECERPNCVGN